MKKILSKFKYRWAGATKALPFSDEFVRQIYKIYLNHNKVIHYRDGYPVYSLSTPALYSKPSAHFFSRLIFRVIQNRPIPGLMSFAINDSCNANCEHCSFFTSIDDKSKKTLTYDEISSLIKQAQELGVTMINIVGGEPLLHPRLNEVIRLIDKDTSEITLFTNGWLLEELAQGLRESGLNNIYVSIDSADSGKHDKKRQKKGLYDKALKGIKKSLSLGFTVGISCCLNEQGFRNKELEKIIELAKSLGVHEVLVFDELPVGRQKDNTTLLRHKEWIEELINSVKKYNNDDSYPGVIIYAYSTSHRSVGCSGGTSYFYVTPYGEVCPCDFYHQKFGTIREEPLYKIIEKMAGSEGFVYSKWGGCRVKDPESSDVNQKECSNCK